MRVTRKEVAKLAGVSETTVSFALSGKRYVSDELKKKVDDAVRELNYFPDMIAKTMHEKKTYSIAVLISDLTNPLHMQIINSIERNAMNNGYFVNICGSSEHLERYITNLISRRIDGIFLAADSYSIKGEYIEQLLDNNVSVVFGTVNDEMDKRICGVSIDFAAGMDKIVSYLRGLGHSDIAYVSAFDENFSDVRFGAFKNAMQKYFGNSNPLIVNSTQPYERNIKTGYDLTQKLIEKELPFTALICTNDMMAFGALDALTERGIKIPDDVSVVGIDDIPFAKERLISLTTLSHRADFFGQTVFNVMRDNIADKSAVGRVIIEPEIVIRKTTKAI